MKNGKREKWRETHVVFLSFAFAVNVMLNLSKISVPTEIKPILPLVISVGRCNHGSGTGRLMSSEVIFTRFFVTHNPHAARISNLVSTCTIYVRVRKERRFFSLSHACAKLNIPSFLFPSELSFYRLSFLLPETLGQLDIHLVFYDFFLFCHL